MSVAASILVLEFRLDGQSAFLLFDVVVGSN